MEKLSRPEIKAFLARLEAQVKSALDIYTRQAMGGRAIDACHFRLLAALEHGVISLEAVCEAEAEYDRVRGDLMKGKGT